MKFSKYFILFFSLVAFVNCSSEDDCAKIIVLQNEFTVTGPTGTTIIPEITQTVDCSVPAPTIAQTISELPKLQSFSYTVLEFNFTPDTGNNTSRLQYKIEINNLSNESVKGIPYVTINTDSLVSSSTNLSGCTQLSPNTSCIITFDKEESLNLAQINSINLVKVEYLVYQ